VESFRVLDPAVVRGQREAVEELLKAVRWAGVV